MTYVRLYVVECKTAYHYYVGTTTRVLSNHGGLRLLEHKEGWGSLFTAKHGFRRMLFVSLVPTDQASVLENALTRYLMHVFGYKKANGGNYTNMRKNRYEDRWWMPLEFRKNPEKPGPIPPCSSGEFPKLVDMFWKSRKQVPSVK